ncbi:hypothetical protein [Planococcus sp. YIM B11945]|uniref:hypothetical protein n=1 Tax=Planococcus sp. YIM B11945 TaxID=3435410 RepID=UPI003D7CA4E5
MDRMLNAKQNNWPFVLAILLTSIAACLVYIFVLKDDDVTEAEQELGPNAFADYDMEVHVFNGSLTVSAEIEVANKSANAWKDVGFNFVPNALHERGIAAITAAVTETRIYSVRDADGDLYYKSNDNQLFIQLPQPLEPGQTKKITVEYALRNQNIDGTHQSSEDDLFFSQWYPEIAHYNKGWSIHDVSLKGDTVYPTYSDFIIHYKVDSPRFVVSSAVDGEVKERSSGSLESKQTESFAIGFLNPANWTSFSNKVNDTNLRFFLPTGSPIEQTTVFPANEAFSFFEENIGDHPSEELDLIGASFGSNSNVIGMGEPPIEPQGLPSSIASQWFGELVLSDPYEDAWLSRSLSKYAGDAYLLERGTDQEAVFEDAVSVLKRERAEQFANLPLNDMGEQSYGATLYEKVPLLLRDFFQDKGGSEAAIHFLSDYYNEYKFQHVDSRTFAVFFEEHYEGNQSEWLNEWLKLDE